MKSFIFISLFFLLSCNVKEKVSSLKKTYKVTQKLLSCQGEECCNQNQNCKQKCEELFLEWENKEKCFKEFADLVEKMHTLITKVFKKPNEDNLVNINLNTLQSVLTISEKSWLVRINKYSRREAQAVLFWLASHPEQDVFSYRVSQNPIRLILMALLRQNARTTLWDDNALLSGLKEPVTEKKKHLFEVTNQKDNMILMSHAHKQIVAGHLCDYHINHPIPAYYSYQSDYTFPACVLAVYCHLTGSYSAGKYVAKKGGQDLRKNIAGELMLEEVESFIEADYAEGGLEITDNSDDWTDSACERLSTIWNDGNLKFDL